MAFARFKPSHMIEDGFYQRRSPARRPVYGRHPITVSPRNNVDKLDAALIFIIAAIFSLLFVNVKLMILL